MTDVLSHQREFLICLDIEFPDCFFLPLSILFNH